MCSRLRTVRPLARATPVQRPTRVTRVRRVILATPAQPRTPVVPARRAIPAKPANPCNPCAPCNPCGPCGACNPCNPCAAGEEIELTAAEARGRLCLHQCGHGQRLRQVGQSVGSVLPELEECRGAALCLRHPRRALRQQLRQRCRRRQLQPLRRGRTGARRNRSRQGQFHGQGQRQRGRRAALPDGEDGVPASTPIRETGAIR